MVDFCFIVFGLNSIDNAGMTVISSVHYSRAYCNAFWDGRQMTYGDGDGVVLLGFARSNDFIGHELAHGVTQYVCGLEYTGEPGALNESVSDVLGSVFRQWQARQTPLEADWMIGSDLMGPIAIANGWNCVRNLADPQSPNSLTKQPKKYSEYIPGGDVHDNSGIPNHAFYLAATSLSACSWEIMGKVWYSALKASSATTNFKEFAVLTIEAAIRQYPDVHEIAQVVKGAWTHVEVL